MFSKTKDKIEKSEISNVVYEIPCTGNANEDCSMVYGGTTKNIVKTRMAGHRSDIKYKYIKTQKTALTSHCSKFHHNPNFDNVKILNKENNNVDMFLKCCRLIMYQLIGGLILKQTQII